MRERSACINVRDDESDTAVVRPLRRSHSMREEVPNQQVLPERRAHDVRGTSFRLQRDDIVRRRRRLFVVPVRVPRRCNDEEERRREVLENSERRVRHHVRVPGLSGGTLQNGDVRLRRTRHLQKTDEVWDGRGSRDSAIADLGDFFGSQIGGIVQRR